MEKPKCTLVGENGNIAYAGGPGPWGFKPEELEQAIVDYIAECVKQCETTHRWKIGSISPPCLATTSLQ